MQGKSSEIIFVILGWRWVTRSAAAPVAKTLAKPLVQRCYVSRPPPCVGNGPLPPRVWSGSLPPLVGSGPPPPRVGNGTSSPVAWEPLNTTALFYKWYTDK